jgi:hypothetical protein
MKKKTTGMEFAGLKKDIKVNGERVISHVYFTMKSNVTTIAMVAVLDYDVDVIDSEISDFILTREETSVFKILQCRGIVDPELKEKLKTKVSVYDISDKEAYCHAMYTLFSVYNINGNIDMMKIVDPQLLDTVMEYIAEKEAKTL